MGIQWRYEGWSTAIEIKCKGENNRKSGENQPEPPLSYISLENCVPVDDVKNEYIYDYPSAHTAYSPIYNSCLSHIKDIQMDKDF